MVADAVGGGRAVKVKEDYLQGSTAAWQTPTKNA
jgi:hypothetical protein